MSAAGGAAAGEDDALGEAGDLVPGADGAAGGEGKDALAGGRVDRLVMLKECLAAHIVPFIITEELKLFYYRGLHEWGHVNGYLTDTCLTAQDHYKALLDYFRIKY